MTDFAPIFGCLALLGWIYLALFHARFWKPLRAEAAPDPAAWPSIDIIVPARDEADMLPRSLPSLLTQDYPGFWRIILVDDHSTDGTGDIARKTASDKNRAARLNVIAAPDLPQGWKNGKLAAMQAGLARSGADYVLFTDADIEHPSDSLGRLAARAITKNLDLASVMVKLHCETAAEKLLIPAFVFFFAMLYPFRRANNPAARMAAAAGGAMLVKRKTLHALGGLAPIKTELIDDCALAKLIKRHAEGGGRIELTLEQDIKSLRVYPRLGDIGRMVARTAFAQLRYSPILLLGTVLGMGILFIAPILLPVTSGLLATATGFIAALIMIGLYMPMIRFYNLPPVWAITLPLAAAVYIAATIDSARLYWQGKGGQWKNRFQA